MDIDNPAEKLYIDGIRYIDGDEDRIPTIYKFERSKDIYEIICYFIERKISNDHFYMVNINGVLHQLNIWRNELPYVFPHYAIKSNPDSMIIKVLAENGCGFDCASKSEMIETLQATDASKIIYANPCKEITHLQYAKSNDVDLLTFDSENELHKIKLSHPKAALIIRIQVDDSGSLCRFNSKFGVPGDSIESLINLAKVLELNLIGVSFHVGSGCSQSGMFQKAINNALYVFKLAYSFGYKLNILDIGGGFPGNDSIAKIKFADLANEIKSSVLNDFGYDIQTGKMVRETEFISPDLKIIAEPGRFFSTNSHTLVCNIIGIKKELNPETKKTIFKYTINEGVYGSFNCILFDGAKPTILPYNERDEAEQYESIVFGPTCDSVDIITKDTILPEMSVGDWLFVENFGAYTRASTTTFNGFKPGQVYYYQYK